MRSGQSPRVSLLQERVNNGSALTTSAPAMQLGVSGGEGGVDLAFRRRRSGHGAASLARRVRFLHLGDNALGSHELFGFTSRAITLARGTSSDSSYRRLGISSIVDDADPVRLPPGRARLATSPSLTGSPPCLKTIGIVEVALFAASAAGAVRHDHIDLAADEIGGQCEPIIVALCPAVFDRHVLSFDVAGFAQSLAERAA